MDDSALLPHDGTFYHADIPAEQVREANEEKATVQAGRELLEIVIKRLESRITYYESIDSVEIDLSEKPEIHQRRMYAHQIIKSNLEQERDFYTTLRDQYK